MPQLIRTIDDIAAERDRHVLFVRFGSPFPPLSLNLTAKRMEVLERLGAEGYAYEPCAPPPASGWLSYLGDVALEICYEPGEARYEALRAMFEDEGGAMLDQEVVLCLYAPKK